ncbi:hypothetical protein B0H12DRAFT_1081438 [Mycena haematopus]|nr:hypothetical protein B0H12DRAFT_1081438 [Mycena haematopus]
MAATPNSPVAPAAYPPQPIPSADSESCTGAPRSSTRTAGIYYILQVNEAELHIGWHVSDLCAAAWACTCMHMHEVELVLDGVGEGAPRRCGEEFGREAAGRSQSALTRGAQIGHAETAQESTSAPRSGSRQVTIEPRLRKRQHGLETEDARRGLRQSQMRKSTTRLPSENQRDSEGASQLDDAYITCLKGIVLQSINTGIYKKCPGAPGRDFAGLFNCLFRTQFFYSKGFTVLKEDLRKAGSRLGARDAGKGEASRRLRRVSRCNPTGSGSMSPLPGLHIQEWGAVIRMLSHPGGR